MFHHNFGSLMTIAVMAASGMAVAGGPVEVVFHVQDAVGDVTADGNSARIDIARPQIDIVEATLLRTEGGSIGLFQLADPSAILFSGEARIYALRVHLPTGGIVQYSASCDEGACRFSSFVDEGAITTYPTSGELNQSDGSLSIQSLFVLPGGEYTNGKASTLLAIPKPGGGAFGGGPVWFRDAAPAEDDEITISTHVDAPRDGAGACPGA